MLLRGFFSFFSRWWVRNYQLPMRLKPKRDLEGILVAFRWPQDHNIFIASLKTVPRTTLLHSTLQ